MKAALAAANVPTAGLLERAEIEALYWKLKEAAAAAASSSVPATAAPAPSSDPPGAAEISAMVATAWEDAKRRGEVERCASHSCKKAFGGHLPPPPLIWPFPHNIEASAEL